MALSYLKGTKLQTIVTQNESDCIMGQFRKKTSESANNDYNQTKRARLWSFSSFYRVRAEEVSHLYGRGMSYHFSFESGKVIKGFNTYLVEEAPLVTLNWKRTCFCSVVVFISVFNNVGFLQVIKTGSNFALQWWVYQIRESNLIINGLEVVRSILIVYILFLLSNHIPTRAVQHKTFSQNKTNWHHWQFNCHFSRQFLTPATATNKNRSPSLSFSLGDFYGRRNKRPLRLCLVHAGSGKAPTVFPRGRLSRRL